jgi:head-tail adaptor
MIASGRLTHRYELQRADKTRNSSGESLTTWTKVRTFLGSYDQETYSQAQRRGQVGGNRQAAVVCRKFSGIDASMRLVCLTRGGAILSISSIVEGEGNELAGDLVITVEEAVA